VLNLANKESAVLLTSDKDFGEMVFRQGRSNQKKGYGVRSTLLTDDIHKKVGPLQMRKEDEGYANKFIRF